MCAEICPGLNTCLWTCRADDDVAMVLMHMLGLGCVPETGALVAALVDAGAALLACNAELALARCPWPRDATCRTLCGAALRCAIRPSPMILAPCSVPEQAMAALRLPIGHSPCSPPFVLCQTRQCVLVLHSAQGCAIISSFTVECTCHQRICIQAPVEGERALVLALAQIQFPHARG